MIKATVTYCFDEKMVKEYMATHKYKSVEELISAINGNPYPESVLEKLSVYKSNKKLEWEVTR